MIPITFTFRSKEYSGYFKKVAGGGSHNLYHLMVNKFYLGQLLYTSNGWQFSSNTNEDLKELSEYFGEYVTNYQD